VQPPPPPPPPPIPPAVVPPLLALLNLEPVAPGYAASEPLVCSLRHPVALGKRKTDCWMMDRCG